MTDWQNSGYCIHNQYISIFISPLPPWLVIGVWLWGADCGTVFNLVVRSHPGMCPGATFPDPCLVVTGEVLCCLILNEIQFFFF